MIHFVDGPAEGIELDLRRAPLFLRVVRESVCNNKCADGDCTPWDALDQLEDVPRPTEQLFCYRLTAAPMRGMIDYRSGPKGGARRGHPFIHASYAIVGDAPPEGVMRENHRWRLWVTEATIKVWPTLPQDLREYFTAKVRKFAEGEVNRG